MTRNKIPRLRLENHTMNKKEEEVPEGESIVEKMIFLEEAEEAEEER
jgi:hypothetical protein